MGENYAPVVQALARIELRCSGIAGKAREAKAALDDAAASAGNLSKNATTPDSTKNALQSQLDAITKMVADTLTFQAPERLQLIISELRQLNDNTLDIRKRQQIQADLLEEDKYLRTFSGGRFNLDQLRNTLAALDHQMTRTGGKTATGSTGRAGSPPSNATVQNPLTTAATKGEIKG